MYKNGLTKLFTVLAALMISACANIQHQPTYTTFEEAGIETNDSNALKIHKLAKSAYKVYDVKVSTEKYEKGGYGLGLATLDITTGALGVGLSNSAGLSGAVGSMGIGFLLSPSIKPYKYFTHIHIVPESDITASYQEELGQRLLSSIPAEEIISTETKKVIAQEYLFTSVKIKPSAKASADIKAKLDENGHFTYTYTTNLKPASIVNGKILEQLLGMKLKNENYHVYAYGVFVSMAKDLIDNNFYSNKNDISLMYVPPQISEFTKYPEVEKIVTGYPYLYNVNTDRKLLFVSPKA